MSANPYVYADVTADRPGLPLVFAFHGTGGDETQFLPLARKVWPGSEVIAPRGDVSEHGALRFFRRRAEGVYDFEDLEMRRRAVGEFVRAHKKRLSPIRTIGVGYSNGANILAVAAFAARDLFDELALMHPLIPWTPADQPGLAKARVLITAGRRDPICPPANTLALEDYFRRQGADTTVRWHDGGHELRSTETDALSDWSTPASNIARSDCRGRR